MQIANYEYAEQIGQGGFGTIYKGRNVKTGEKVVVKTEPQNVEFSSLKHESNILNLLYSKSCRNIPPIYWYGVVVNPSKRILVMPFYDESLEQFARTRKMTKTHMSNIMRSAISILEHIHVKYVVHRDIKPANFMIHNDELILIDFGLASFYVDSNERHLSPANPKKMHIIGTPKYVSWNVHCGEEYSRRDDLMSLVYVGLYLIYGGELWASPPIVSFLEKDDDKSLIMHPLNQWFKTQKDLANIRSMTGSEWEELDQFAKNVYSLSFQERPSYKDYIRLFLGRTPA